MWPLWTPSWLAFPNLGTITLLYFCISTQKATTNNKELSVVAIVGFGLALGYASDLLGSTPVGLQALMMALSGLILFFLSRHFLAQGKVAQMGLVLVVELLQQTLVYVFGNWAMDGLAGGPQWGRMLTSCVLTTMAVSPWFWICRLLTGKRRPKDHAVR